MAKDIKESKVADPEVNNDMLCTMMFWREDRPLAIVGSEHDKDVFLRVAQSLIPGMAASGMILVTEQYSTTIQGGHPDGRAWEPGEFQRLHGTPRGDEFNIKENLVVTRYARNPGFPIGKGCQNSTRLIPFDIVGNTVVWGEDRTAAMEGWMSRVISSFFEEVLDLDDPKIVGFPNEDVPYKRLHADMGCLRAACALFENVKVGYFADKDDPEEMEIVETAMKKMGQYDTELWRLVAQMTN